MAGGSRVLYVQSMRYMIAAINLPQLHIAPCPSYFLCDSSDLQVENGLSRSFDEIVSQPHIPDPLPHASHR